jgi:hypothetical protein
MSTRRAFVPVGRLVLYVVLIAAIGGAAWYIYDKSAKTEEDGGQLVAPDPSALSKYLVDQHRSAATNPAVLALTDAAQLSDKLAVWLGTRKTLEDLFGDKAPVQFVGARESRVPGGGAAGGRDAPSVQLVFKTDAAGGADRTVSLFLKKYMQSPRMDDKAAFTLAAKGPSVGDIVVWRSGGLLYNLVGPQAAVDALRGGLGAPPPSGEYPGH